MASREYNYEELLNILSKIHTEPSFTNIKEYIESNRGKFSVDEYKQLESMIRDRERYFNPSSCNGIREIRLYYRDNQGHEFSNAYSGEKGKALCREAKDTGMTLSQYITFLGSGSSNGYILSGWTLDASGGRSTNMPNQIGIQRSQSLQEKYVGRTIRRMVRDEEENNAIQVDMAGMINHLREEIAELIRESAIENRERIKQLQNEIREMQSRTIPVNTKETVKPPEPEKPVSEYPKTISVALQGQPQYLYFMRYANILHEPIEISKPDKGVYKISVRVSNQNTEERLKKLIEEAEKKKPVTTTVKKEHHPDHQKVLDDLCKVYVEESGMPCGLSRTGALSTLADRLIDYAKSVGSEWDVLYDLQSINLFAQKGQIYTKEQADEAFNNVVSSLVGRGIGKVATVNKEEDNMAKDAAISDAILEYDAYAYVKEHNPEIPVNDYSYELNRAIHELTEYHLYPNDLDDARKIADSWFNYSNGVSYNTILSYKIKDIIDNFNKRNERYED